MSVWVQELKYGLTKRACMLWQPTNSFSLWKHMQAVRAAPFWITTWQLGIRASHRIVDHPAASALRIPRSPRTPPDCWSTDTSPTGRIATPTWCTCISLGRPVRRQRLCSVESSEWWTQWRRPTGTWTPRRRDWITHTQKLRLNKPTVTWWRDCWLTFRDPRRRRVRGTHDNRRQSTRPDRFQGTRSPHCCRSRCRCWRPHTCPGWRPLCWRTYLKYYVQVQYALKISPVWRCIYFEC